MGRSHVHIFLIELRRGGGLVWKNLVEAVARYINILSEKITSIQKPPGLLKKVYAGILVLSLEELCSVYFLFS